MNATLKGIQTSTSTNAPNVNTTDLEKLKSDYITQSTKLFNISSKMQVSLLFLKSNILFIT